MEYISIYHLQEMTELDELLTKIKTSFFFLQYFLHN